MESNGKRFDFLSFKVGKYNLILIYEKGLAGVIPGIKEGMRKASAMLDTENDIILSVSSSKDKFIEDKMDGVNGFAPNRYSISLDINQNSRRWKEYVEDTVIHEFNHVIRFQRKRGAKVNSLADKLVLEGLAQCFAEDITGNIRPWSCAISNTKAKQIWKKLKGKLNVKGRDFYFRIFLNKNDKEFPHWSGYTLGYLIIRRRIKDLRGGWNKAMNMDTKALIGNGLS